MLYRVLHLWHKIEIWMHRQAGASQHQYYRSNLPGESSIECSRSVEYIKSSSLAIPGGFQSDNRMPGRVDRSWVVRLDQRKYGIPGSVRPTLRSPNRKSAAAAPKAESRKGVQCRIRLPYPGKQCICRG